MSLLEKAQAGDVQAVAKHLRALRNQQALSQSQSNLEPAIKALVKAQLPVYNKRWHKQFSEFLQDFNLINADETVSDFLQYRDQSERFQANAAIFAKHEINKAIKANHKFSPSYLAELLSMGVKFAYEFELHQETQLRGVTVLESMLSVGNTKHDTKKKITELETQLGIDWPVNVFTLGFWHVLRNRWNAKGGTVRQTVAANAYTEILAVKAIVN